MCFEKILTFFDLPVAHCEINEFGSGLINKTWTIQRNDNNNTYILQKVNHFVFKSPQDISSNINLLNDFLQKEHPSYYFVTTLKNKEGKDLYISEQGEYFRIFPFVKNSYSVNAVGNTKQAYEAASQFAKFVQMLEGLDVSLLKTTLKDFHNLTLRYEQFQTAIKEGNAERIAETSSLIEFLLSQNDIVNEFENIKQNNVIKLRVTHHDTKISNVLFTGNDDGCCVIDLDTVMPGYYISDVGDMFRTYLSPANEEEQDFSKIIIRPEIFKAIAEGYLLPMQDVLSKEEKQYFIYAGKFMIYMQALRFLTDYLNNDVYYGKKYEKHNLVRAENQIVLLKRLLESEPELQEIVELLENSTAKV